jgi:hypothetical protein
MSPTDKSEANPIQSFREYEFRSLFFHRRNPASLLSKQSDLSCAARYIHFQSALTNRVISLALRDTCTSSLHFFALVLSFDDYGCRSDYGVCRQRSEPT